MLISRHQIVSIILWKKTISERGIIGFDHGLPYRSRNSGPIAMQHLCDTFHGRFWTPNANSIKILP